MPDTQNLKPEQINIEKLEDAVSKANDIAQLFYNTHLNFSVDDKTKELVVRVIDEKTGEVIRQIPPEEMLRLIAHFDKIQSLLFSKKY
jgi:flagellar protein FlaG